MVVTDNPVCGALATSLKDSIIRLIIIDKYLKIEIMSHNGRGLLNDRHSHWISPARRGKRGNERMSLMDDVAGCLRGR